MHPSLHFAKCEPHTKRPPAAAHNPACPQPWESRHLSAKATQRQQQNNHNLDTAELLQQAPNAYHDRHRNPGLKHTALTLGLDTHDARGRGVRGGGER